MSSSIGRSGRRISRTVFVAAAFVCAECCAAVAGAQDGLPSAAASERAGVLPLPTGPPPTGLQSPLPKPARPLAKPDRPLLASPSLAVLGGHYASQPLTINDAVAVALATSRSLELANQALFEAQGRTSEARAGFRPTLGGNFTYTRLNTGETVSFGGQSFTIVNPDQPVFALSATLPIDIAGMLHAATDQARFQEIAARIDVNRACNELVADVKGAFYSVLRSRALVVVAGENLDDSLARLGDAQAKFHAGTVARLDVIRAQTDVANAQQQLIQARSGVSQAIAVLNNTIGIDVNWPTQVSDKGAVAEPPNVAAARSSSAPFGSPAPPADFGSPRASVSASVNATPHASSVA